MYSSNPNLFERICCFLILFIPSVGRLRKITIFGSGKMQKKSFRFPNINRILIIYTSEIVSKM